MIRLSDHKLAEVLIMVRKVKTCRAKFTPSPKYIRRCCRRIQRRWTPTEERQRRGGVSERDGGVHWHPQVIPWPRELGSYTEEL